METTQLSVLSQETASHPDEPVSLFFVTSLALSAFVLGQALRINFGFYHPLSLALVTISLLLCGGALMGNRKWTKAETQTIQQSAQEPVATQRTSKQWLDEESLVRVLGMCLVLSLVSLATVFNSSIAGCFGFAVAVWMVLDPQDRLPPLWRKVAFYLIPFIFLTLGVVVIRSLQISMDVFIFQQDSSQALLQGKNPYSITFRNPYGDDSPFYGPGMSVNGQLQFGYVYTPLSLLMVIPAYILAGDVRYAHLVAILLSAGFMASARTGRVAFLGALLFLFTPTVFYMMGMSWTESLVVLPLSAVVFCACRAPGWLPLALGLLLASKQYLILSLPLTLLLFPRPTPWREVWRLWGLAILVAAFISLPLILWNVADFWKSAMALQFRQPFRPDALSYLAWVKNMGWGQPPSWVAFLTLVPTTWLALRYAPRNASGYAAAVAFVFMTFFVFNKQAFCNYYFFVIGALCCAVAAARLPQRSDNRTAQHNSDAVEYSNDASLAAG
jgi:hypothetical protein